MQRDQNNIVSSRIYICSTVLITIVVGELQFGPELVRFVDERRRVAYL
jgi:hypothetical protein